MSNVKQHISRQQLEHNLTAMVNRLVAKGDPDTASILVMVRECLTDNTGETFGAVESAQIAQPPAPDAGPQVGGVYKLRNGKSYAKVLEINPKNFWALRVEIYPWITGEVARAYMAIEGKWRNSGAEDPLDVVRWEDVGEYVAWPKVGKHGNILAADLDITRPPGPVVGGIYALNDGVSYCRVTAVDIEAPVRWGVMGQLWNSTSPVWVSALDNCRWRDGGVYKNDAGKVIPKLCIKDWTNLVGKVQWPCNIPAPAPVAINKTGVYENAGGCAVLIRSLADDTFPPKVYGIEVHTGVGGHFTRDGLYPGNHTRNLVKYLGTYQEYMASPAAQRFNTAVTEHTPPWP